MPIFNTFRIDHEHLAKVLSVRTEHNIQSKVVPVCVKTTSVNKPDFNTWKQHISKLNRKRVDLVEC